MSKRKDREQHDAMPDAGVLLGVPVGESMSRDDVDGLEFSAKQHKRPKGMSRARYFDSGPGKETQTLMAMAGVDRYRPRTKALFIVALGLLLGAVGFGLVWWLAS